MSVAAFPQPHRELWAETRVVRFTGDAVSWDPDGPCRVRTLCPYCGDVHSHFAPPGMPPRDIWRVPDCEAVAPAPRAYLLRNVETELPPIVEKPKPRPSRRRPEF